MIEKQLLKNQADKTIWEANLPKPLHGQVDTPEQYPSIVIWSIQTNEWDSKDWISTDFVYPQDFTDDLN